ncbi:MAG: signal peptidase I [SAR202 cluster bacterium]|jgi:signal peptidase I|nr:MAG: signal peptidase I [SAR202 cluster bacterium]MQG74747.1 signal peptidase I [SAR202 cluster bacterium]
MIRIARINNRSMEPTLRNNDLVITSLVTNEKELKRGQVVLVRLGFEPEKLSIKRIIGLQNETLEVHFGQIHINGSPLSEPYIGNLPKSQGLEQFTWNIPEGHIFLLSDFRNFPNVVDSRTLGPIHISKITEIARLRIWPPLKFF